jgi:outer membrane protein TolC
LSKASTKVSRLRLLTAVLILASGGSDVSAQEPADAGRLTLTEATERARQSHPSVGMAAATAEAAAAAVGQANSAWWPQLTTRANVTSFEEPMLVAPIHGFAQGQVEQIEFANTLVQGNLSLGWTIFDGKRVNQIRGARATAAGAELAQSAVEMGLTARVTRAYLRVLTARGILDAIERRTNALAVERGRVEQFLEQGRAARVELLRVEAALAQAEAERVATATRLDLAERDLARLVDLPPEETRAARLQPVRLAPTARLEDRQELLERALANNPELEAARRSLEAAEAERRVARASWIPSLSLAGNYQLYSSDNAFGADGRTTAEWNVGVALSYPLFTGGNRSSVVSRASAEARRAREELRQAELESGESVDRALNAALETGALVEALARAEGHQSEVARIELLSLEAGAGTQTDYLRAEADLARARSVLVEARHNEIAAWVEVARVVGELTPEWLARTVEAAR